MSRPPLRQEREDVLWKQPKEYCVNIMNHYAVSVNSFFADMKNELTLKMLLIL